MQKQPCLMVSLIEEADPLKQIGAPFTDCPKTVEAGYSVLLAGQGADELFGATNAMSTNAVLKETKSAEDHV